MANQDELDRLEVDATQRLGNIWTLRKTQTDSSLSKQFDSLIQRPELRGPGHCDDSQLQTLTDLFHSAGVFESNCGPQ